VCQAAHEEEDDMARPSKKDAQAAVKGNQKSADQLREQGRTKDAAAAQTAADHWRKYLAGS
jgi:hypothetical protein